MKKPEGDVRSRMEELLNDIKYDVLRDCEDKELLKEVSDRYEVITNGSVYVVREKHSNFLLKWLERILGVEVTWNSYEVANDVRERKIYAAYEKEFRKATGMDGERRYVKIEGEFANHPQNSKK